jgi:hypothetical protein
MHSTDAQESDPIVTASNRCRRTVTTADEHDVAKVSLRHTRRRRKELNELIVVTAARRRAIGRDDGIKDNAKTTHVDVDVDGRELHPDRRSSCCRLHEGDNVTTVRSRL